MALLENRFAKASPHAAQRPSLDVGDRWSETFTVKFKSGKRKGSLYKRTETCTVAERKPFRVADTTFDAVRVDCTGQRHDRELPRHVTIQYDTKTGLMLSHLESWEGSSPGWVKVILTKLDLKARN